MLGDAKQARLRVVEALKLAPRDTDVIQAAVGVYEELGERQTALRWLQEALKLGYPREKFERDPTLVELRKDSRYRAFAGASIPPAPAKESERGR
jgi:serine/threonine-protein kinase